MNMATAVYMKSQTMLITAPKGEALKNALSSQETKISIITKNTLILIRNFSVELNIIVALCTG